MYELLQDQFKGKTIKTQTLNPSIKKTIGIYKNKKRQHMLIKKSHVLEKKPHMLTTNI